MQNKISRVINKINSEIIGRAEIERVIDVLRSGFLSKPDGGPVVEEFQALIRMLLKKKYAYAVSSGTAALHSAIVALELNPADEVIIPALANIADCSVVMQEGAKPVFADIDPKDFNIDPGDIKKKITSQTKAIVVVHMFGLPARIDKLKKLASDNNIILIEDCAQATGARYHGEYVGSFGDLSCTSLYQTKHIVCGEGGVVATSNEKFAKIITSIANNGIMKDDLDAYNYDRIGFNYQITDVQAAIGIEQFKRLNKRNEIRRRNAGLYRSLLKDLDIEFQAEYDDIENAYFYLTGVLPERLKYKREEFMQAVRDQGVPIKKLYPISLPEVTLVKGHVPNDCPVAENVSKRLFNLYVNPGLEESDIALMSGVIRDAYEKINK